MFKKRPDKPTLQKAKAEGFIIHLFPKFCAAQEWQVGLGAILPATRETSISQVTRLRAQI